MEISQKNQIYSIKIFFDWHGLLTGSCRSGRLNFMEAKELTFSDKISVKKFVDLTKNEYNGEIIKNIQIEMQKN